MTIAMRNYKNKDVDMLLTSSTILESAVKNKILLQAKRSNWTDAYFNDLKTRINTAMQTYLGVDSAKDLRNATIVLTGIQNVAIKQLAEVKIQITEDFKTDKPRLTEILKQLGFTTYLKGVRKGDQEALINLLYQFKTNLTPALITEISGKGTSVASLNAIITFADNLKDADVTQETFKGGRKTITTTTITEFNFIYDSIISICRISSKFFIDQPHIRDQFSYSKVSKALNTNSKNTKPATPPVS